MEKIVYYNIVKGELSKAHDRDRTGYLILTKDALYQLSYMGAFKKRAMRLELTTTTLEGWSSTN
jgi:hypothetical protein